MKKKIIAVLLVGLICLLVMPLSVAQADGGDDFGAADQRFWYVNVGPNIDSVAYDTELSGNYNWHFFIINDSNEAVSSPTISVDSTLDPVSFPNVDEFPATWSLESLGPGEMWILPDLASDYPVTFTPGYNCSRTMEPLEIPPEGGVQTVTIKVKPVDERYTTHRFMQIHLNGSVVEGSNSQPDGAETMLTSDEIYWNLQGWELGVEYTFSVDLEVENPWGVSFVHKPSVSIYVEFAEVLDEKTGTSTTIPDEILDGFITYSVPVEGNWSRNIFNCWMVDMELSQPAPVAQASVDIDPNTLNLKSRGKWVTVYIELPESYDVYDIDINTVMLNGEVPAESDPKYGFVKDPESRIGDYDDDGIPDCMVKFDRLAVQGILAVGDEVEITVTGEVGGIPFEGSDIIRVK